MGLSKQVRRVGCWWAVMWGVESSQSVRGGRAATREVRRAWGLLAAAPVRLGFGWLREAERLRVVLRML